MRKNKEILFILPNLRTGGAQKTFIRLANIFFANKNKIEILVIGSPSDLKDEINSEIKCTFFRKKKITHSFFQLIFFLVRRKPYAIVTCLNYLNIFVIISSKIASPKSKVFISERGVFSKELKKSKLYNFFFKKIASITYRFANSVIAVSHGVAKDLSETLKLPLNDIEVIYNPSFSNKLIKQSKSKINIKYKKVFEKPTIVSVGRLEDVKGYDILIKSFAKVSRQINCSLIIIGEGSQRKNLVNLIERLGLNDLVYLPGIISNPYPYIREANVYVLSSRHEGLPNVLIEAMAIGTPLIATDCIGSQEIIGENEWGYLIDKDNPDEMAKTIIKVLKNNEIIDPKPRSYIFHEKVIFEKYNNLIFK
ncbi:glycosyltransferase [uncultured Prochlorococcus sp.]|uniref:glycosyltransferase n=1 Tax=uncultured Prochlorococcus sp. TaxID=159733 RepID=UPI00259026D0|nr:glycosyltransferase [uncultured Prochlorococcus sp.]